MSKRTARAVIYARISLDDVGDAAGVQRQEQLCRDLCAREGYEVVGVFVDNDISASSYSKKLRPAWQEVVRLIETGAVDVLVGWHPDRFTRRIAELESLIDLLNAYKVTVQTVAAGAYDLSNATSRMTARLAGVIAQGESERTSERLKAQKVQAASMGQPHGKQPYGYDAQWRVIEAEAVGVRFVFDKLAAGLSLNWVAHNMPTLPRSGKPWTRVSVWRIAHNPVYAGLRQHHGKIVAEGTWEAIVSRDRYETVRAILSAPDRKTTRRAVGEDAYLMSGLGILTDDKGNAMTGNRAGGAKSVGKRYRTHADVRPMVGIKAEAVDKAVDTFVRWDFLSRVELHHWADDAPTTNGDEIAKLERELADVAAMYGEGAISAREWLAAKEPLQARLTAAQGAVRPTTTIDYAKAAREWPTMDLERKRQIIKAIIKSVKVAPSKQGRNIGAHERVTIEPTEDAMRALRRALAVA